MCGADRVHLCPHSLCPWGLTYPHPRDLLCLGCEVYSYSTYSYSTYSYPSNPYSTYSYSTYSYPSNPSTTSSCNCEPEQCHQWHGEPEHCSEYDQCHQQHDCSCCQPE